MGCGMLGDGFLGGNRLAMARLRPAALVLPDGASVALEMWGILFLLRDWPGHVSNES